MSDDPVRDLLSRERAALGADADTLIAPPTDALPVSQDVASMLPASRANSPEKPAEAAMLHNNDDGSEYQILKTPTPLSQEHQRHQSGSISPANMVPLPMSPTKELPTEHLRKAAEDFKNIVAERDAKEEELRREKLEKAKREIDKFYEEYDSRRATTLESSKTRQEELLSELNSTLKGTFWERVIRIIDSTHSPSFASTSPGSQINGVSSFTSPITQPMLGLTPGVFSTSQQSGMPKGTNVGGNRGQITQRMCGTGIAGSGGTLFKSDLQRFRHVLTSLRSDREAAPGA